MITLTMLMEKLTDICITDISVLKNDTIGTVRIFTGENTLREHTLYLYPELDSYFTLCMTPEGSSFILDKKPEISLGKILDVIDLYNSWDRQMDETFLQGCTLTDLLDITWHYLSNPLFVLDSSQWMLGYTTAYKDTFINEDWAAMLQNKTSSSGKITDYNAQYSDYFRKRTVYRIPGEIFSPPSGYACNLFHGRTFCGVICMIEYPAVATNGAIDFFRIVCGKIQRLINTPNAVPFFSVTENYLENYLEDYSSAHMEDLRRNLQIHAWQKGDPFKILVALPADNSRLSPNIIHSKSIFSRAEGIVAGNYKNSLVLMCNQRLLQSKSSLSRLHQSLEQISYCAGESEAITELSLIRNALHQARISYEFGIHKFGVINSYQDHMLPYLISLVKKEDPDILEHPLLAAIEQYDKHNGSRLSETLFSYLKNERSIVDTAAELQVSRSTLNHRIERLQDLVGDSMEDPQMRILLLLSFYSNTKGGH